MFSKRNKTVFQARWRLTVEKDTFILTKTLEGNKYALLDDVESADEDDGDNLMNDSDTEFVAEEKITKAASTQDTSLNTPEANLYVVPSDNQWQSEKKKKNYGSVPKKVKVTKQEQCHLEPKIQSKWNSFPNRNIIELKVE